MQERLHDDIVKTRVGHLEDLMETAKNDMENGVADSFTIANIEKGDTFKLKGLEFRVTGKGDRGRIRAKLI